MATSAEQLYFTPTYQAPGYELYAAEGGSMPSAPKAPKAPTGPTLDVAQGLDALSKLGEKISGKPSPRPRDELGTGIIDTPETREKDYGLAKFAEPGTGFVVEEEPSTMQTGFRSPTMGLGLTGRTTAQRNPLTGGLLGPYRQGFADGGLTMPEGSFILDARTVSEIGNGSSRAGQERLAQLGGIPLQGPGDGVSDSIRANIGGTQQARVARDEVLLTPDAVARIGNGDMQRGTKKLYQLMEQANKARRTAQRGQDTKVHRKIA